MMKMFKLISAGAMLLTATMANAATVLVPTDGDVNFFVDNFFVSNNLQLAIFNDQAGAGLAPGAQIDSLTYQPLQVILSTVPLPAPLPPKTGGLITFSLNSGTYEAQNENAIVLVLDTSPNFIVAASINGTDWFSDNGGIALPANSAVLSFDSVTFPEAVDVRIGEIPVPAAVWLFGSGLLGLVAAARRRA